VHEVIDEKSNEIPAAAPVQSTRPCSGAANQSVP
jgi:hypothetical protein